MYKTIRHGENSLQYTILPQNDDFRLEGKIKSAGSSKKSKTKKPKRRSFFAYLGLLFVCTVIVGAVLVPFLVSAECLPNPTEWFLKTKAAFTTAPVAKDKETAMPLTHSGNALGNAMLNKGNVALNKANLGKAVKIIHKDGVEKIILKVNKTSSQTEAPPLQEDADKVVLTTETQGVKVKLTSSNADEEIASEINSVKDISAANIDTPKQEQAIIINDLEDIKDLITPSPILITNNDNDITAKAALPNPTPPAEAVIPTTSAGTLSVILLNRTLSSASVPNVPRASLQSSLNQQSNSNANGSLSTQPTITTRIMQVPLLKSTAKKPAIPPVLVKNLSPIQPTTTPDNNQNQISNLNDIIPAKANAALKEGKKDAVNSDWIHTHWPYIDPSTYFQWNVSITFLFKVKVFKRRY